MKRSEARMIAEELYRLMKEDGQIHEEWLSRKEAADYLGKSLSWMNHHGESIPRTKIGGSYRYSKSGLNAYLNRIN